MKISDNQNISYRIPYDGIPLREGEVRVPQMVNPEDAELLGAQDVRVWYQGGVPIHVMYVPVASEEAMISLQTFNSCVNMYLDERLGPNRRARCWVLQPDGSYELCPRERNGKHNPCTGCPMRGRLEKEDRNPVSLDELEEENYAPMASVPSAESCAMEGIILKDLLDELSKQDPIYADIVRLGYEGLNRKEIVDRLPVQKSRGYELYNECRKAAEKFMRE